MVLVDTSVWIDHLRRANGRLQALLETGDVVCHPFVIGEMACGSLRRRDTILGLLSALPQVHQASSDDVLAFIGGRRLHGLGIGLVDAHLLWCSVEHSHPLWTHDRRLRAVAARLAIDWA